MTKPSKLQILLLAVTIVVIGGIVVASFVMYQRSPAKQGSAASASQGDVTKITDFRKVLDCFPATGGTNKKCIDDFILGYAGTKTTKELLADLELNRSGNTDIENNCHPIAHAIGRWTYGKYGNIGDAFLACDQTCHSGCYHGVMERLFYTPEQLTQATPHLTFADMQKKVPDICDSKNFKDPSQAVIFQCLHGVGHAILYSLDYNLTDALKSCDLLATDYEKQSCYGGVIMENITAFDKSLRDLKKEDPQYPCDKLDTKYKYSCYQMQTSVMVEFGMAYDKVPDECRKAGDYIAPCFVSLGRDLSNYARTGNGEFVRHICEDVSGDQVANCINGAVYALIDNTWDASFAYPFCSSFKNADNMKQCFMSGSGYVNSIYGTSHEQLVNWCNLYAGDKKDVCIASLPAVSQ